MTKRPVVMVLAVAALGLGGFALWDGMSNAQGRSLQTPPVPITIRDSFDTPPADDRSRAITAAAQAFLATLTDEQRQAAIFAFDDNTQRANWSNFPDGAVQRAGVMRGDLSADQLAALDALLAQVLSVDGTRNVALQLAAEDNLATEDDGPNFGSDFYYASFLGEPAETQPWMFQFGGHHLAINATFNGADTSFSPMLTGGEPLRISFDGQEIYITQAETAAAQAFMDSLDDTQKQAAIRSDQPINLLLGPGEFGTTLAPEGIRGSDLTADQQALLLAVIQARVGFANADDAAAIMEKVQAEIDDTYFGWWGPEGTLGAAYFRVTAPSLITEYAPQDQDGDATDHAHNMYRDPTNDYGAAWIAVE